MSKWPGKYVIGLTGNIATGKSVIRRMLEHLGAYGIDADALAHRAIARGAPGYQSALDAFGKWILDPNGEVDRVKLGRLVFTDPEALKQLETIVHPLVEQAVDLIVKRAGQRVIVIEAIKLLEGKLAAACDTIWATYAPESAQKARLVSKRNMTETDALQRIRAQGAQEVKTGAANVVIQNAGSFEAAWNQVVAAWKVISPITDTVPVVMKKSEAGELSVQRGRPRDSAQIAALVTRLSGGTRPQAEDDIMAAFGEKAFLLLRSGGQTMGLIGWQVENLVARTTDIFVDPSVPLPDAIKILMTEVENASRDLQCEASLLFLPPQLASQETLWKGLGYERRSPQALGVQAWQDAALESMPANAILLFKQLRQDRVLRPI
ncbi:MAG: dephospho-CoA kinase [Anaerolineaceae bacterium]|nr:MAG: dephospho-CoA kinase [Anaerolineaceae bacterium]